MVVTLGSPPTLAQNLHSTPPDLLGSAAPQIFTRSFEKRRESIVNGYPPEVASSSTEKFHHNTMPLNPPNESSKSSASLFTIKSRSPSDKPAFPQPETSEPIPYTQGDHQSSSSRKSKRGTSRHRQFLAELLQFYPHLSSAAGEANGISDDPSPTDSHAHRPSHSRSHSQPSRHSSHSISGILIMTTERLHTETARANAAEKQVAEVMSLFRNTHDQKSKSDRDLARAREELGWYKIQLDVAQKEIFRAQETVERVDRQRIEAEEAAAKAREKSRKLVEARAVDLAMEEGRRLGFEEGLKHGRVLSQMSETHDDSYSSSRRRSASRYKHRRNSNLSKDGSSESLESDRSSLSSPKQTQHRHPRSSSSSKPEEIAIQDANASMRPIPNRSPAASRRSIQLPDNYIPTLNADATITLPPPHELNIPVPPEVPQGPSSALGTSSHHHDQEREKNPEKMKEGSYFNMRYTRPTFPESSTPRREPLDSDRIMPNPPLELAEPRSPSTYPNRPPRKQREIVMPVPLGGQFLHGGPPASALNPRYGTTSNPIPSSSTQTSPPTGSRTRTTSSPTIPNIKVETPSTTVSAVSEKTTVDPILLTPDHANRPVQLPPHAVEEQTTGGGLGLYSDPTTGQQTLTAVLPDNNFPPGFLPLSPIPGMANLNPYPPPSLSKDPGFVYPSSPLRRPE